MNLNLVLTHKFFEMTGEPGKMWELRKPTKWIKSRLYNPDGSVKNYNFVELCSGYKSDRPTKKRIFAGFVVLSCDGSFKLPNGERIPFTSGDFLIYLKPEYLTFNNLKPTSWKTEQISDKKAASNG